MKKNTIRIATRKSKLALWQANFVKTALEKKYPEMHVKLVKLVTLGDQQQSMPLVKIGGKSVFVKKLQQALLDNEADIAVHSLKDMSVQDAKGLMLSAICKREDPRDAFVSNQYPSIEALPRNAIVGTASPRRTCLLKAIRPDVTIKLLRGNVDTRIKKCASGEYDAIILATAGLKRLGLTDHIRAYLSTDSFIPAIGQGAMAIECRENDSNTQSLLTILNDEETARCVLAERTVNKVLNGDCHTPLGAYAQMSDHKLHLRAMVGSINGDEIIQTKISGKPENAEQLGKDIARDLLEQGAEKFL